MTEGVAEVTELVVVLTEMVAWMTELVAQMTEGALRWSPQMMERRYLDGRFEAEFPVLLVLFGQMLSLRWARQAFDGDDVALEDGFDAGEFFKPDKCFFQVGFKMLDLLCGATA